MAFIPITIWQVFERGQWQFQHIEEGHSDHGNFGASLSLSADSYRCRRSTCEIAGLSDVERKQGNSEAERNADESQWPCTAALDGR
jgi:hypothetical protein